MRRFVSRKLIAALGSTLVIVMTQVGLPADVASSITDAVVLIAGTYLIGQGAVDTAAAIRNK